MDQGTDPVTGRTADVRIDTTQTSSDPDAIADDIRETRAEMDETIGALSAKLDPSNLMDQAKAAFTSSAKDAGTSMMDQLKDSSVMDTIKDNPLPAAAVGLSIAWFLSKMGEAETDRYRDERYRATGDPSYAPRRRMGYGTSPRYAAYGDDRYDGGPSYGGSYTGGSDGDSLTDKASGALDTAKDKTSDALDTAKTKASDAVDSVKHTASDLAQSAKDALGNASDASRDRAGQAGRQMQRYEHQAASWLDRQMTANPLAIGAVALAAGALVGLSVPETDAEDRAFGDQADDAKRQLASVASEKVEAVKGAAQDVAQEAKEKAASVANQAADKGKAVADDATSRAENVAGEAKQAAGNAADAAKDKANDAASSKSGQSS